MSKKGLIAMMNNGIEFLIGSLILILVTKTYGVEDAGAWIVFLTILFIGTKFREGITQTSLIKFSVGVEAKQRHSIYWISILITIVLELIVGLGMLGASLALNDELLSSLLFTYLFLALPQSIFRLLQYMFQSRLEVNTMVSNNLVLLNLMVLSLFYVYELQVPIGSLPIILSVSYWIAIFWQLFLHKVWSWKVDFSTFKLPSGYLHFASNGLLRELFGTISSRAYILLTAGFVGYTESAFVGIASRYANLIYLPNSAYQGLLYPKACDLVNRGFIKPMFGFYRRSISWMQAAFIPYVIGLLTVGSLFIVLLHGTEFIHAIPFFAVLVLSGAFVAPQGHAYGSICQAAGRPDLVTKVVLINSVINLILSVALIYFFGVWGAVLAPVITDLFGLIIISKVIRNVFSLNMLEPSHKIIFRLISLIKILKRQYTQGRVLS